MSDQISLLPPFVSARTSVKPYTTTAVADESAVLDASAGEPS